MADRTKKIANTLQTYFSDANLLWDKVLGSLITKDKEGFVPFDTLSNLTKFKQLKATADEIKIATELHALDKLKIKDNSVARIKPYVPYGQQRQEDDDRSIYVEGLSTKYKDEAKIVSFFEKHVGPVTCTRIPKNKANKINFCGFCFVEFETSQLVEKAINVFENDDKFEIRVMSKLEWLKYKDQYLAYLNKKKDEFKELWSKYNAAQMDVEKDESHSGKKRPNVEQEPAAKKKKTDDTPKQLDYTPGIIVRVSKLHLDSPKTVVMKLLEKSGSKIAFMKPKRKGIDSTFIRLETPQDAIKLHGYFESHHVVQKHGKDETGDELDAPSHETVSTKIIEGRGLRKEEEIYWEEDRKTVKK